MQALVNHEPPVQLTLTIQGTRTPRRFKTERIFLKERFWICIIPSVVGAVCFKMCTGSYNSGEEPLSSKP